MTCVNLRPEKQLCKVTEARDVFVPATRLLHLDIVETEPETFASSTINRYRHARTASRRLLTPMAALLTPAATHARWRNESLGELRTLHTSRSRARFAARTLSGVPRLAVTLGRPALRSRQARP